MLGKELVLYPVSCMFEPHKGSKVYIWPGTVNICPTAILQLLTWVVILIATSLTWATGYEFVKTKYIKRTEHNVPG